jgi:hypothetical protein
VEGEVDWLGVVTWVVEEVGRGAEAKVSEKCSQGLGTTTVLLDEEDEEVEKEVVAAVEVGVDEEEVEEGPDEEREDERVAVTIALLPAGTEVAGVSLDVLEAAAGGSLAECEPLGPSRFESRGNHSSHLLLQPL